MLYALIAGTLHHAVHLGDALALLSAVRWDEMDPLYRARTLLFGQAPEIDGLTQRLRRSGAFPRRATDRKLVAEVLRDWRPQLLILLSWQGDLATDLRQWLAGPQGENLRVLALGPEGDDQAMAALDAGVHAYLTYPLSETLLIAQASALLRGGQGWEGTAVEIPGVLRIDPMAHRIWVQEQELQLSRRIFRLFHYLALHPGQTFSAAEIAHHLSDGRKFVQENTIAAQIHRLRKALEAAGADIWLETVHGFGYRLSVPAS